MACERAGKGWLRSLAVLVIWNNRQILCARKSHILRHMSQETDLNNKRNDKCSTCFERQIVPVLWFMSKGSRIYTQKCNDFPHWKVMRSTRHPHWWLKGSLFSTSVYIMTISSPYRFDSWALQDIWWLSWWSATQYHGTCQWLRHWRALRKEQARDQEIDRTGMDIVSYHFTPCTNQRGTYATRAHISNDRVLRYTIGCDGKFSAAEGAAVAKCAHHIWI